MAASRQAMSGLRRDAADSGERTGLALGWRCPQCSNVVAQRDGVGLFAPDLADTISGFDPLSFDRSLTSKPNILVRHPQ